MPERPDLEYLLPILAREIVGRRITGWRLTKPAVLRISMLGDPATLLGGRSFSAVKRHGPFVRFALDSPIEIVIHPMLTGRFALCEPSDRHADLALAIVLDDGRELRYRDDRQMGKVYVAGAADRAKIPGFEPIGVDLLAPDFTLDVFQGLVRGRRDQVKSFLLDHAALDTLGNAYADEVLWECRIHPKTRVNELTAEQIAQLHRDITVVLTRACAEIARRKPSMNEKLRDFLAVRNRKGQPCPRCKSTIRACGVNGYDAFFCPQCQPDARGRGLVDWTRIK